MNPDSGRGGTVFWRVAAILIGAQLLTGLLAALLTRDFASERQRELALSALESELDAVAEEIERRARPLEPDNLGLPDALLADLGYRFPDPMVIVGLDASIRHVIQPVPGAFDTTDYEVPVDTTRAPVVPDFLDSEAAFDDVHVDATDAEVPGGFGFAPLYDAAGFPVGGVLVQPILSTVDAELAPSRAAQARAQRLIAFVSVALALALGALFTWLLVRPLRRMTDRIYSIADGQYDTRIEVSTNDEFGRLASSINEMAARVEESIESIRAADRLRRELIANVGHDLRTPLAVLSGSIEEGRRYMESDQPDRAADVMEVADRQIRLLSRLIDDLFELAVLEQDRPPLRLEPVLPAELAGEAAEAHADSMRESRIDFSLHVDDDVPMLRADGARLLRVLNNLLANARRHTPAGGSVGLSVSAENGGALFEIVDSGEGIEEQDLENIFERYYRVSDARTREEDAGTGLGLSIARAIAEAHDGHIHADSRPGDGTTVRLFIPAGGNHTQA